MATPNNELFSGYRLVTVAPHQVTEQVIKFKRHRKKRRYTPRVVCFSHWKDLLEDGEIVIQGDTAYANRRTNENMLENLGKSPRE